MTMVARWRLSLVVLGLCGAGCEGVIVPGGGGAAAVPGPADDGRNVAGDGGATDGAASQSCVANIRSCSADGTGVDVCNATGTQVTHEACPSGVGCAGGQCRRGPVVIVHATDSPHSLAAGHYAMAVVDVDATAGAAKPYPVALTGEASSPAASPATPAPLASTAASPSRPRPWCGTPQRVPAQPSATLAVGLASPHLPLPTPVVGDKRTFLGPSNETLTTQLRAVAAEVNIWEDQTSSAAGAVITDAVAAEVVERLDRSIVARDQALLGPLTDVDGNGKVDVIVLKGNNGDAFADITALFAPSFWGGNYNYGEVVWAYADMSASNAAELLAWTLSHEIGHLLSYGNRWRPYLATGPASVPPAIWNANVFLEEGIAEMQMVWAGQVPSAVADVFCQPSTLQLPAILPLSYDDLPSGANGYDTAAVALEYLFEQAGGIRISPAGAVEDLGGLAYMRAVASRASGLDRIAPLDGRTVDEWYVDLAAALLLTTIEDANTQNPAEPRYHFGPTLPDPQYSGRFDGLPLRYEWSDWGPQGYTGPLLQRLPWSQHGPTLAPGGFDAVEFSVTGAGATLTVTSSTAAAVLVAIP